MTKKLLNLLCILVLLLGSVGTFKLMSKEIDIAFGQNRPPYVFHELGVWKGIEIDIVREALRFKGHSFNNEIHVVNKRLKRAVSTMGFDASVAVQQQEDGTYYSDFFITYINYAISRKKDNLIINDIKDLSKYTTVAWQNAYINLGEEYESYFGPNIEDTIQRKYAEFGDQERQNAFFWIGRAQVIVVDKFVFDWFRSKLSVTYDTSDEVVYHDIFPSHTYYQVNFKNKSLRDDFNKGLQHLRDTGQYQEIIKKYLH